MLYYYLGPITFLLYPFSLFKGLVSRLKVRDFALTALVAALVAIKYYASGNILLIQATRFHWGFVAFLFFFRSKEDINIDNVLRFVCIVTIVDVVLANFIIAPKYLPNYARAFNIDHPTHVTKFFGFYQRPFSFGGSPTISSSILVILFSMREDKDDIKLSALALFSILLCMSGTGFMTLMAYFAFRNPKWAVLGLGSLLIFTLMYGFIGHGSNYGKISPAYIRLMFFLKLEYIKEIFVDISVSDIFFGIPSQVGTYGGDFSTFNFFVVQGLFGFVIFLAYAIFNMNRRNFLPILLFHFSTLHYATTSFFPGQILYAYVLTRTNQTRKRDKGSVDQQSSQYHFPKAYEVKPKLLSTSK